MDSGKQRWNLRAGPDGYMIVSQYNLLAHAYHVVGVAYKFLLTLSSTQVACERSFSALKYVKGGLRSCLPQEHLEAFMLMSTEFFLQ